MALVKSGCLHRQSTILRRWKKNWFELWSDGRLIFYDDQYRRNVEGEIHMKVDCINIRSATACRELTPPEGKGRHSLFQIVCRCGRVISLCAQSAADALAWTMALQDARVNTVVAARHFGFTQEVIASAPPSYWDLNPNRQVLFVSRCTTQTSTAATCLIPLPTTIKEFTIHMKSVTSSLKSIAVTMQPIWVLGC
ncbi:pleckstrin homology domain-containing family B member 2 isoform X2 [Electrophorus electricus]|uniref:pleckstrin homology domain-containing family B member 2 isoform X2 n=1 Tax=Electrophorus electricus TaxID=8005 RepID=UPI0015D009B2|nr:pleckstrin homology domain-containing family B member 2 isoform X2 [Electrophorus electricus]